MQHLISRLAPLASAGLVAAMLAAPAGAAVKAEPRGGPSTSVCGVELVDSSGLMWDLDAQRAFARDGGSPNGSGENFDDTYDRYGFASVGETSGGYSGNGYSNPDVGACTFEEDGREIVFPLDDDVNGTGIGIQRKVYVPASGPAFARWLDILVNPTGEPITVPYRWSGNYGEVENATATASGDTTVTAGERWASFIQDGSEQGQQASLWDGPNASDGWDALWRPNRDFPGSDAEDDVDFRYADVTIPANGRAVFLHVEHQNRTTDGAREFAQANGDGRAEFFAAMTADELVALRNWTPDSDRDGLYDHNDNCVLAANADQADLDRDGKGDACDDDIDGDGLPNAIEAGFGADPRNADSDGDGVRDGQDQCPSLRGTINGCPAPVSTVIPSMTGRALPNAVTLSLSARRGRAASGSRAVASQARTTTVVASGRIELPQGVPASTCELGRVAVLIKRAERTVSTRIVDVKSDCTYRSTVRFKRSLGTKVRAKSYFFGSRGLVGRAAKATSASVK